MSSNKKRLIATLYDPEAKKIVQSVTLFPIELKYSASLTLRTYQTPSVIYKQIKKLKDYRDNIKDDKVKIATCDKILDRCKTFIIKEYYVCEQDSSTENSEKTKKKILEQLVSETIKDTITKRSDYQVANYLSRVKNKPFSIIKSNWDIQGRGIMHEVRVLCSNSEIRYTQLSCGIAIFDEVGHNLLKLSLDDNTLKSLSIYKVSDLLKDISREELLKKYKSIILP